MSAPSCAPRALRRPDGRCVARHLAPVAIAVAVVVALASCDRAPSTLRSGSTAGAAPAAPGGSIAGAVETNAIVSRVVDGDTIVVDREGVQQTIRLIGIDTPETKKPGTPVECFGKEASAHMHELLPDGTPVRLERDADEKDRYDRTLAYVYRADGLFVNLAMAEDGFAGQLTIPPNVAHADELGAAAARARDADKGLWRACGGNHVATR